MTLRFLTGVALVAGGAAFLAKRYRKQIESAGTAIAADTAAQPTVSRRTPPQPRTVSTPPAVQPDANPPAAAI